MDALDFQVVVIPLALLVFGLVAGIILLSKKHEIREKRRLNALVKVRAKQRELLKNQMGNLDELYQTSSIDHETYKRLKTIVKMNMDKNDENEESVLLLAEPISEK